VKGWGIQSVKKRWRWEDYFRKSREGDGEFNSVSPKPCLLAMFLHLLKTSLTQPCALPPPRPTTTHHHHPHRQTPVQHTTELTAELARTMLRHNARRYFRRRALLIISETLTREPGPALVSLADCLRWQKGAGVVERLGGWMDGGWCGGLSGGDG